MRVGPWDIMVIRCDVGFGRVACATPAGRRPWGKGAARGRGRAGALLLLLASARPRRPRGRRWPGRG